MHSLKLIAAHAIVNSKLFEQLAEDELRAQTDGNAVVATSKFRQLSYADLQTYQVIKNSFFLKKKIFFLFCYTNIQKSFILNKKKYTKSNFLFKYL